MKVHLLYLKKTKMLYGISIQTDVVEKFLFERNPKCFIYKTEKMSKDEFDSFLKRDNNKNRILSTYPLSDNDGSCVVIATAIEDEILSEACDIINKRMYEIKKNFSSYIHLKEPYNTVIDNLTDCYISDEQQPVIVIDTVKLFYRLFQDTFMPISELELLEKNESFDSLFNKIIIRR